MPENKGIFKPVAPEGTSKDISVEVFGQVIKGIWWMPWYGKAMKDVVSCDKLRLGANSL